MKISTKWEFDELDATGAQLNHLLLELETPPDTADQHRQPLVVVLALDKSWSMKGEKLDALLTASSYFINWLTRHDYVAVVAYAAEVQIVQSMVKLTEKKSIVNRLKSIQLGTATNLSGGWLQALKIAQAAPVQNAVKRVILLTDGLATMGIQDDQQLFEIAQKHVGEGISTTTIGFGSDFNEASLQAIAKAGGGNFYFVDSPEKMSDIFFREFGTIGSLYAQAAEVKITLPPNYRFLELLDELAYDANDNSVKIQLGDLRSDDVRNLVLAVEVTPEKDSIEPLNVQVDYYKVASEMKSESESMQVPLKIGKKPAEATDDVALQILISWAGKTMIDASKMAENDIDGAIEILDNMILRLKENIKLAARVLQPLAERLEAMQKHLREDSILARKQLMASGVDIYSENTDLRLPRNIEMHDKIFEFNWSGELDMYNSPDLKQVIKNKISDGYRFIILDLSETPFIDSSAIGTLIQISNWLNRRNGQLVVTNLSSTLEKLFKLTHLDTYLPVAESVTGARMIIESRQTGT